MFLAEKQNAPISNDPSVVEGTTCPDILPRFPTVVETPLCGKTHLDVSAWRNRIAFNDGRVSRLENTWSGCISRLS